MISTSEEIEAAWQPIHDTAKELRSGCLDFEQAMSGLFDEVDRLRAQLLGRMREVEVARAEFTAQETQIEERRGELDRSWEELRSAQEAMERQTESVGLLEDEMSGDLDALRKENDKLRLELENTAEQCDLVHRDLASRDEQRELLDHKLEEISARRDELHQDLEAMKSQSREATELGRELEATKQQLADAHEELDREQRISRGNAVTASPEELAVLEQEREALQEELEIVRNRAIELDETVVDQQRALNEHNSGLSNELQQLRRLVDQQAELINDRATPEVVVAAVPAGPPPSQPNDPVVASVMAQFAKLQKDVARRRGHQR